MNDYCRGGCFLQSRGSRRQYRTGFNDPDSTCRASAEAALQKYCEDLRRPEVDIKYIIRIGEPEIEILAEINSTDYDLVAMGHARTFLFWR